MDIKKKIKFTIIFLFVFLVVSCAGIYGLFTRYASSLEHSDVANQVMLTVISEQLTVSDYFLRSEYRSKIQWDALQEKSQALISSHPHAHGTFEEDLVQKIQTNLTNADVIFKQLVALGDDPASNLLFWEKRNQLMEELSIKTQETSLSASRLAKLNTQEASMYLTYILVIFSGVALLLFVILIYNFRVIWNGVNRLDMAKTESQNKQERLDILMQSIGDGVVAIDREWNITLWNKAATRLTGWQSEEVIGKPLRDFLKFIFEHNRKDNIAFIEEAMLFGRTGFMEEDTIFITKDGREVPVKDSASPIFNKGKEVSGVIIVFRDASKEREAQGLRSDFAYASHQLRTPVSKAMWNLEAALIMEDDLTKLKDAARIAYNSMKSVQKLSEELLEVSRIDKGEISVVKEYVVLSDLITEVVGKVKKTADEAHSELTLGIVEAGGINTSKKLLMNALSVILDNAVIYSHAGARAEIKAHRQNNDVLIEITDDGIGIPEEHRPLVFTKFFRGSNFDTTAIPGAGLGLWIAKAYISLLGGKVWFESAEGKGTTFFVSLPVE